MSIITFFDKTISVLGDYKLKHNKNLGYYVIYKGEFVLDKHYNVVHWINISRDTASMYFKSLVNTDYANWGKDCEEKV